jgi:hypothetical protein
VSGLRKCLLVTFVIGLFVALAQHAASAQVGLPLMPPPPPPPTPLPVPALIPDCINAAMAASSSGVGTIANDMTNLVGKTYGANGGLFGWMQNAVDGMELIFAGLLAIQIIQDVADYMFETAGNGSLSGFFTRYAKMLVTNGIVIVVFLNAPLLVTNAFGGATDAGMKIIGAQASPPPFLADLTDMTTFKPGALAVEGGCLAANMWTSSQYIYNDRVWLTFGNIEDPSQWNNAIAFFNSLGNLFRDLGGLMDMVWDLFATFLATLVGSACVWIVFALMSLMYALVSLEVVFICGIGAISLGGLGHRAFHQLPTSFLTRAFGLLMKVVALGAIVALGQFMVSDFENIIANVLTLPPRDQTNAAVTGFINIAITSVCYYIAAVKIPAAVEITFSGANTSGFGAGMGIGGAARQAFGAVKGGARAAAARVSRAGGSGNARQV